MYKDYLTYRLAENIDEKKLLKVAGTIIDSWMKDLDGFISWEILRNEDGSYSDIVCWKDRDSAKKAEKEMCKIPNAADWYRCYEKSSITSTHLESIFSS